MRGRTDLCQLLLCLFAFGEVVGGELLDELVDAFLLLRRRLRCGWFVALDVRFFVLTEAQGDGHGEREAEGEHNFPARQQHGVPLHQLSLECTSPPIFAAVGADCNDLFRGLLRFDYRPQLPACERHHSSRPFLRHTKHIARLEAKSLHPVPHRRVAVHGHRRHARRERRRLAAAIAPCRQLSSFASRSGFTNSSMLCAGSARAVGLLFPLAIDRPYRDDLMRSAGMPRLPASVQYGVQQHAAGSGSGKRLYEETRFQFAEPARRRQHRRAARFHAGGQLPFDAHRIAARFRYADFERLLVSGGIRQRVKSLRRTDRFRDHL